MKAYAIHRPLGMGTYPTEYRDHITDLVNYDGIRWVDDIAHMAFGHIDYDCDVPRDVLERYELWVSPLEDWRLMAAAKTLRKCEEREDWERYERAFDLATGRYGYSLRDLERAQAIAGQS